MGFLVVKSQRRRDDAGGANFRSATAVPSPSSDKGRYQPSDPPRKGEQPGLPAFVLGTDPNPERCRLNVELTL